MMHFCRYSLPLSETGKTFSYPRKVHVITSPLFQLLASKFPPGHPTTTRLKVVHYNRGSHAQDPYCFVGLSLGCNF